MVIHATGGHMGFWMIFLDLSWCAWALSRRELLDWPGAGSGIARIRAKQEVGRATGNSLRSTSGALSALYVAQRGRYQFPTYPGLPGVGARTARQAKQRTGSWLRNPVFPRWRHMSKKLQDDRMLVGIPWFLNVSAMSIGHQNGFQDASTCRKILWNSL